MGFGRICTDTLIPRPCIPQDLVGLDQNIAITEPSPRKVNGSGRSGLFTVLEIQPRPDDNLCIVSSQGRQPQAGGQFRAGQKFPSAYSISKKEAMGDLSLTNTKS